MPYTVEQLSIVCPRCRASIGGKCLAKTLWGSNYMEEPHPERGQEGNNEADPN